MHEEGVICNSIPKIVDEEWLNDNGKITLAAGSAYSCLVHVRKQDSVCTYLPTQNVL